MRKKLTWLLLAEFLVVIAVGLVFKIVERHLIAGFIAGSLFVILGIVIITIGIKDASFRKRPTFVAGCVHLFGIALPLLITRALTTNLEFSEVHVLGLPGPVFHQISTWVYSAMMIATVVDVFHYRKNKKASV
jgi:hypothetical protein